MPDKPSEEIVDTQIGSPLSSADRLEMMDALERCIHETEYNRNPLKVPLDQGRLQKHPGMHFHFKPEIFIQMKGWTDFELPTGNFPLKENEVCILPAGLPHKETIYSEGGNFRNLVVGFYSNAISLHLAFEVSPKKPEIDVIEFYDAPNLDLFLGLTNSLVDTYHKSGPSRERIMKGLTIGLFSMLKSLVETGTEEINKDIGKVFQAKWIIREQISNTKLNVKTLADRLQCSPDYLSHLFHSQTGEKLIHYIQRIRIEGATLALQTTPLYVSEIAWSSGFSDPAYFARVFKKFMGMSPLDFRAEQEAKRNKKEAAPKTIYYDREDFSAGESHRS
ncbi:MAG: helix-turn-helix transcriptional regulator [Verrucomicrobiota bacterium]